MIEDDPFSGLRPTRTPPELREQVLRAARKALARGAAEPSAWELLWRNRALRLGWTAACTMLVAGHVALTLWHRRPPGEPGRVVVAPTREPSSELHDVLYLPSIERLATVIDGSKDAPLAGAARKGQGT